ncbi:MAG TPA: glycosyltransferase [Terracidiphilus sp.]|jgi:glycosyltransferase involved in cell wall biosynthesis
MQIVYLLTSLGIGGAERLTLALAERMRERGHAVAVFTLRPRLEHEWPTTLPVFRLGMRRTPVSFLAATMRARRYLRDLRPDLIHSHGFHANIFARLLKLLLAQPKVISTIHNVYEGGGLRMWAYRCTDPLSRRTAAISEAVASRFIALRAVPASKCTVIANAIDLAALTPDPAIRRETRARLGAGSDFIWLAAGRLTPAKDYPNLLRAFAHLRATHPQARLWIAGEGSSAQLAGLDALAEELGLTDGLQWLGLRRDLPALLDAADGFVLGSAWEGMPLALAEAMAMEKPIVATDVGGVRELVGETGHLVPPHHPELLAQAMQTVMAQSSEDRAAQARAAHRRIQQNFSMETRAEEWESFYNQIVHPGANL